MSKRHTIIPASYLILKKENKILLIRRYNTGFEDGNYSMVAGHVDPGETFTEAMIREAREEAGITLNPSDMKMVHMMHRKSHVDAEERIDAYFLASTWTGELTNKEPHKCDDFSWYTMDSLPENIIPYIRVAIQNVQQHIPYSEYGWDT
jgi:8-oxo-dGTP diphosphatase